MIRATVPGWQVWQNEDWLWGRCVPRRSVLVSRFLDPRSGRLVTIKMPEEPPRQPLKPVMRLVHHLPGWSEFYIETTCRLRITAISRSALTSMNVRARAIRMTSPQKCAPMAALRIPKWSAIPMLR